MPQQDAGAAPWSFAIGRNALGHNIGVAAQSAALTPGGPIPKAIGAGLGLTTGMGTDPVSLIQNVGGFLQRNLPLGDASGGGILNSAVGGLEDLSNKLSGGMRDVATGVGDLGAGAQDFFSKLFGGLTGGMTRQSVDPRAVGESLSPGTATTAAVLSPGRTLPSDAPSNLGQLATNAPDKGPNRPNPPDQARAPRVDKDFRQVSRRYDTQTRPEDERTQLDKTIENAPSGERNRNRPGTLDQHYLDAMKFFEGYRPHAYKDYGQVSSGYGTRAQRGDENIPRDKLEAVYEKRFQDEVGKAAASVDTFSPNLPPGIRAALTSLTYNAGARWQKSGLGVAVKSGDYAKAREIFQQYNKAGGKVHSGLAWRRQQEAAWFDGEQ